MAVHALAISRESVNKISLEDVHLGKPQSLFKSLIEDSEQKII